MYEDQLIQILPSKEVDFYSDSTVNHHVCIESLSVFHGESFGESIGDDAYII